MGVKPANHGRRHYRLLQTWARLACAARPAVAHYAKMKADAYKRRAMGKRDPVERQPRKPKRKMVNSRKRRRDRAMAARSAADRPQGER